MAAAAATVLLFILNIREIIASVLLYLPVSYITVFINAIFIKS